MLRFISTGFYSGIIPFMPGTFGSAAACLTWLALHQLVSQFAAAPLLSAATHFPLLLVGLLLALLCLSHRWFVLPYLVANGKSDPGEVVLDEWAGCWLALMFGPADWRWVLLQFILFRIFDITKPFGIKTLEKLPAPWGVLADDLLAGLYALILGAAIWSYIN